MKARLPLALIALVTVLLAAPAVFAALRLEPPVEPDAQAAIVKKSGPTCSSRRGTCAKVRPGTPGSASRSTLILVFEGVPIIDFTWPTEARDAAGLTADAVAGTSGPMVTIMGMKVGVAPKSRIASRS